MDGAGIAGGNAEVGATGDGLEAWIAMGGHFAQVGDGLEAGAGFAELAEDFVFHARGHDLGVGATAVENRGGIRHSCSWGWGQRHELERARVVTSRDVSERVVTMNSQVVLRDLDSGQEFTCRLSFPDEADVDAGLAALQRGDLPALGRVMESSTLKMHAAMMTSDPPLLYWQPGTVALLHAVWRLRAEGMPCWCTMDAGPQVKVLCPRAVADEVAAALRPYAQVVHVLGPGPDASVTAG